MQVDIELQEWAQDASAVMLGWALAIAEGAIGDLNEENRDAIMDSYPMRTFTSLYQRGVALGLLQERSEDEDEAREG